MYPFLNKTKVKLHDLVPTSNTRAGVPRAQKIKVSSTENLQLSKVLCFKSAENLELSEVLCFKSAENLELSKVQCFKSAENLELSKVLSFKAAENLELSKVLSIKPGVGLACFTCCQEVCLSHLCLQRSFSFVSFLFLLPPFLSKHELTVKQTFTCDRMTFCKHELVS